VRDLGDVLRRVRESGLGPDAPVVDSSGAEAGARRRDVVADRIDDDHLDVPEVPVPPTEEQLERQRRQEYESYLRYIGGPVVSRRQLQARSYLPSSRASGVHQVSRRTHQRELIEDDWWARVERGELR